MPAKIYNNIEEKRAAKARQTLESQKRNGHKNQKKYDKASGWRQKKAQRARRKAIAIRENPERELREAAVNAALAQPPVAP
jgi:nitrogen fixation protein FixH